MKKDGLRLFEYSALFSIISVKLVSAASPGYYVQSFLDWINSNYGPLFGALLGSNSVDDFLFAKVLILFLIFAVVFMVLKTMTIFRGNRPISFLISAIVSILSVRYMGENDFIIGVLLPYGALGASITLFLPLLIYFMFVNTSVAGGFGRRAAWFVYGLILLLLWGSRTVDMSSSANWMYTFGLIFVLINFIFDKSIHAYFELGGQARPRREMIRRRRLDLQHQLKQAIDIGDTRAAEAITRELNVLARDIGD